MILLTKKGKKAADTALVPCCAFGGANSERWWAWQKKFLKGLWLVVTSMGNWKGVTSLIIVWLILSGIGVAIVGFIIQNTWLVGVGLGIFAFWAGPGTPLMLVVVAIAMIVQRYIFQDRSVSVANIKAKFKEAFKKD